MKRVTLIATAFLLAVLAVFSGRVAAQDTNTQERTFLTFSNTVELPNLTLPAGTYVFRLADTPSRNVVQVLSRDEKEMLGQWTFVQSERTQVSDETVVMFREAKEGSMPAVQFWYYPGERVGKEFIYPKDQAMKIAARTGQSVMSDNGRISSNTAVSSTDSQGQVATWQREGNADLSTAPAASSDAQANTAQSSADSTLRDAPAASQPSAAGGSLTGNRGAQASADMNQNNTAVGTSGNASAQTSGAVGTSGRADVDVDANRNAGANANADVNAQAGSTQPAARPQPESTQARAELPETASPLATTGLLGLLSLAGAMGVRRFAMARR